MPATPVLAALIRQMLAAMVMDAPRIFATLQRPPVACIRPFATIIIPAPVILAGEFQVDLVLVPTPLSVVLILIRVHLINAIQPTEAVCILQNAMITTDAQQMYVM